MMFLFWVYLGGVLASIMFSIAGYRQLQGELPGAPDQHLRWIGILVFCWPVALPYTLLRD